MHPNQNARHSHQLDAQPQHGDIEELLLEYHSRNDNWLSKRFDSIPFLLYKCWLILSFIGALIPGPEIISLFIMIYNGCRIISDLILLMSLSMSLVLFLYGCGEMLFAMSRRKSRAAQRSFLKFQYYSIGIVFLICYACLMKYYRQKMIEAAYWLIYLTVATSPIVPLVGGRAVLRAFQKNHPLRRQVSSNAVGASNPLIAEFWEQNQLISSELSKYEQRLNRWPYVVYNWWLKFAVVYEISVIFNYILLLIIEQLYNWTSSLKFFLCFGGVTLSLFSAYSRFQMEVAMRTRDLTNSKRAVLLLKISTLSSALSYLFVAIESHVSSEELEILIPSFKSLAFFAALPALCLVGGLRVHKVIEERDPFAQVSSYTSESYLVSGGS